MHIHFRNAVKLLSGFFQHSDDYRDSKDLNNAHVWSDIQERVVMGITLLWFLCRKCMERFMIGCWESKLSQPSNSTYV